MSAHEKKIRRSLLLPSPPYSSSSSSSSKQPASNNSLMIAPPPRAALHGRFKPKHHTTDEPTSTSTSTSTPPSDTEETPPPPQSTYQEKDEKIASLEKEMTIMEDEFERELSRLGHKLTNESETAVFWQGKHTLLHQTFLKTDTALKLLRQEMAGQEALDGELRSRVEGLVMDRDAFREAYNEAVGEVRRREEEGIRRGEEGRRREEELKGLQRQIRGLKEWVSSSGKREEQVADEWFGEACGRLGNGVQNWVISHFRRVGIDTDKAPKSIKEQLLQLVPTYSTLASTSKIHLIQSLVSRLLVNHIFNAYFIGLLPNHAEELKNVEKYLNSLGTKESLNQWRSTTLSIILKSAPQKLSSATSTITEGLVTQINTILSSISGVLHSETRDQSLRALINSSIELSRLLRVQKAVFSVIMPEIEGCQRTMFDGDSMEDIGGEDEDGLEEREIRCVTFFGIVKMGDENGERSHLRNVVAKVRVLCAPD